MTLPAFATIDDLGARLPAGIPAGGETRAQAALDDVSAFIRTFASKDWVTDDTPPVLADDTPPIIGTVCLRAALRVFTNPQGVTQDTAGPYSTSFANASTDVYLTAAEKAMVRRAAGLSTLGVQPLTRGCVETRPITCGPYAVADEYVDVYPPGEPIPFA